MDNTSKEHPQVGALGAAAKARDFLARGGGKACCVRGTILLDSIGEQEAVLREVAFEDQQTDGLTSYCRDLVAEVLGSDDRNPRYLIVSEHRPSFDKDLLLFWAPDSRGYTVEVDRAGFYTEEKARRIVEGSDRKMVPFCDVVKKMVRVVRRIDAPEMVP